MTPLTRWIARVFLLYGLAGIGWGARLAYAAFFRPTPPFPRSGDVVGPPDWMMHRLASGLILALALAVLTAGVLNVAAAVTHLRRGHGALMALACIVDAVAWALVALGGFVRALDLDGDPTWPCAQLLGAAALAALHLMAVRFFADRRVRAVAPLRP